MATGKFSRVVISLAQYCIVDYINIMYNIQLHKNKCWKCYETTVHFTQCYNTWNQSERLITDLLWKPGKNGAEIKNIFSIQMKQHHYNNIHLYNKHILCNDFLLLLLGDYQLPLNVYTMIKHSDLFQILPSI